MTYPDLQEAGLPSELDGVVCTVTNRLSYSTNFDDNCVYCAGDVPPWSNTEVLSPVLKTPPVANA